MKALLTLIFLFNLFFSNAQKADTTININLCFGEKYNNIVLKKDSTFFNTYKNTIGKDSIVKYAVKVIAPIKTLYSKILCYGEVLNSKPMLKDSIWQVALKSTLTGCDSIVLFEWSVIKASDFKISGNRFLCSAVTKTELSVGNFDFYLWSNGNKTKNISVDKIGTYRVTVSNTSGCKFSDSISVEKFNPKSEFIISQPRCHDSKDAAVQFKNTNTDWKYNFDNKTLNTNLLSNISEGKYTLHIDNQNGCTIDTAINIIAPKPFVIDLITDQEVLLGDSIALNPSFSQPISKAKWTIENTTICGNCEKIIYKPKTNSIITIEAENKNACKAKAQYNLKIDKNFEVFIPNIFSPNGDNVNDVLTLFPSKNVVKIIFFKVFDRWGNAIYNNENTEPINIAWDGTYKNELANQDNYTWATKVLFKNGETLNYSGTVFLIK